jgi:hypothetical protein
LKVTPAQFIGEKKIKGMKSRATAKLFLDVLHCVHFRAAARLD